MATVSQGSVEILVHVSAPSHGKDDARYRDLASAYLAFEPIDRQSKSADGSGNVADVTYKDAENQLHEELRPSQQEGGRGPTGLLFDDGDESYQKTQSQFSTPNSFRKIYLTRSHLRDDPFLRGSIISPQASFQSVLDNAGSPDFRRLTARDACTSFPPPEDQDEDSWKPPASEVPETQSPCNRPIPAISSPTRVLELFLQQFPISVAELNATAPLASINPQSQRVLSNMMQSPSQRQVHTTGYRSIDRNEMSFNSDPLYDGPSSIIPSSPPVPTRPTSSFPSLDEGDSSQRFQYSSPSPTRHEPKKHCQNSYRVSRSHIISLNRRIAHQKLAPKDNSTTNALLASQSLPTPPRQPLLSLEPLDQAPSSKSGTSVVENAPKKMCPTSKGDILAIPQLKPQSDNKILEPTSSIDCPPQITNLRAQQLSNSASTSSPSLPALPTTFISSQGPETLLPQKRKQATSEGTTTTPPPTSQVMATTQTTSKSTSTPQQLNLPAPTTIRPPPPVTSISTAPIQLITPSLSELATKLSLPMRYKPISQSRELRRMERGYWRVEAGTWGREVRERAWLALGVYIGKGRAGWGVWCTKEDLGEWQERHAGDGDGTVYGRRESGEGEDDGEKWRVYCWGEIVGHVYLLLYLVSERRVKGTGLRWFDGGGEVVVTMGGGCSDVSRIYVGSAPLGFGD